LYVCVCVCVCSTRFRACSRISTRGGVGGACARACAFACACVKRHTCRDVRHLESQHFILFFTIPQQAVACHSRITQELRKKYASCMILEMLNARNTKRKRVNFCRTPLQARSRHVKTSAMSLRSRCLRLCVSLSPPPRTYTHRPSFFQSSSNPCALTSLRPSYSSHLVLVVGCVCTPVHWGSPRTRHTRAVYPCQNLCLSLPTPVPTGGHRHTRAVYPAQHL